MAMAAVTALLLGCRASEVLQLRVRDLDCGGTKLWFAARDPDVPEVLRPRLLRLTADRAPDAYLFGLGSTGKPTMESGSVGFENRVRLDTKLNTA